MAVLRWRIPWVCWEIEWPSSRAPAAASAAPCALTFVREGASVVINDVEEAPAKEALAACDEIRKGAAAIHVGSVADRNHTDALMKHGRRPLRQARHPRQQRRHHARPHDPPDDRRVVGPRHRRQPDRHLQLHPLGGALSARRGQARARGARRAEATTGRSSTSSRRRRSAATRARSTTPPRRWATSASRARWRRSGGASGSTSTPSRQGSPTRA